MIKPSAGNREEDHLRSRKIKNRKANTNKANDHKIYAHTRLVTNNLTVVSLHMNMVYWDLGPT